MNVTRPALAHRRFTAVDSSLLDQPVAILLVPITDCSTDLVQGADWDKALHCGLVAAAGNAQIVSVTDRDVNERIRIIRQIDFTKQAQIDAIYEEHATILQAIESKRGDRAALLLWANIKTSQAEVKKITLHQIHLARQVATK